MARDLASYLVRVILIIGLCWIMGATRCSSAQLTKEVTEQQAKNAAAKATAAKYVPPGADRDQIFSAIDNSSDLLGRQNKELTAETARADENEAAADLLFWLKIGAALLVAGGLWLKFKR